MRRQPILLVAAIAAATLAAACGAGSPTLPPLPPDATSRPSVEPSLPAEHPSLGASTAASAAPSPVDPTPVTAAPPTPVGGQEAPEVVVVAEAIAFQPVELTVPAGTPFTIGLDNRDAGIPHNIEVTGLDGTPLVKGEIVSGPARMVVPVPALAPGSYRFTCTVHPNMVGTITAE